MSLLSCLVLLWFSAFSARAPHIGPPVWMELTVADETLTLSLAGEPKALLVLLGEDLELVGPLDDSEMKRVEEAFEALFEEQRPLHIDGVPQRGALSEIVIPDDDAEEDDWLVVNAHYAVELEQPARSVGVQWNRYDGAVYQGEQFIPLTVLSGRSVRGQALLHPEEPEYIWHPDPDNGNREPRLITGFTVQPVARVIELPVLSIGIVLGAIALFVLSSRGQRSRPMLRTSAFVALLTAAGVHDMGRVTLSSPFENKVVIPSQAEALAIFESLHQNIYAAFMADTENEIYELLAVSVDASLLDELYGDIYESLILREQGGAICSIEGVEGGVGQAILPREEDALPIYQVDWSWQVNGVVSHWGHLHRRRNEYVGQYEVGHDGQAWKITGVDILEHKRIDLPDPVIQIDDSNSE
ncbi:MAG: hypothetical protein ACI8TQ_001163 [Planctomycetota bacterium]|jgi:hypothetical protein